jgi:hypothetical protein
MVDLIVWMEEYTNNSSLEINTIRRLKVHIFHELGNSVGKTVHWLGYCGLVAH